MPQPVPPTTYASLCSLFIHQLIVSIHTILAAREIYPENTFLTAKAYNLPIKQSRHPGVCSWVNDAVEAVRTELLRGLVHRVVLVIFSPDSLDSKASSAAGNNDLKNPKPFERAAKVSPEEIPQYRSKQAEPKVPSNQPLERYIWDVSGLPAMPTSEVDTPFLREDQAATLGISATETSPEADSATHKATAHQNLLEKAHIDMQEQFRGLISRLSTISSRLKPLPAGCTYTLCIELKDSQDPPIGHPQPWIPSEPNLQRTITHDRTSESADKADHKDAPLTQTSSRTIKDGTDLGGAKTTPVRSIDAGEMVFEMWIEEGSAKFT